MNAPLPVLVQAATMAANALGGSHRATTEALLDRAESLLLHRPPAGSDDLTAVMAVFGAVVSEAHRYGDQRVAALAASSQRLLGLLQVRRESLKLETEDVLLDAVDRIQALLRDQTPVDHSVSRSLERRILALST